MKTDKQYTSFDEYLLDQEEATIIKLLELRECILSAAPEAIEMINYNIPAYALVKGGKRDQQIMIAGYKKHVGFYPSPATIEKFQEELKPYKLGKGSVQFPIHQTLPRELIMEMVLYRKELLNL